MCHRLTIQKPTTTTSESGESTITYQDADKVWADLRPASGTEKMVSAQVNAVVTHRIQMRYREFKTSWRLKHGDRIFDVQSAIDQDERHHWLMLDAVERDPDG